MDHEFADLPGGMSGGGTIGGDLGVAGGRLDPEARLWAAFAAAGTPEAFWRNWLALQCRVLEEVNGAMLLLARSGGAFAPVAVWPDVSQDLSFLRAIAEDAVRRGEPVVVRPPHDTATQPIGAQPTGTRHTGTMGTHVAYPFLDDNDRPVGVVLLDLRPGPEERIQPLLRRLHWGIGWLEAQTLREVMGRERRRVSHAAAALDLVAVVNEHERLDGAAMAVVNELAVRLGASRVALGLDSGRGTRLIALSHTAWFKRKATMVRALEAAMDEAMDQRATVRVPPAEGEAVRIQVAHETLSGCWDTADCIMTLPLVTERGAAGAITLLYAKPPEESVVRLGEAIVALLGPVLAGKQRARRWLSGRLVDGTRDVLAAIAGPRHLGWKLAGATAVLAVTAALLVPAQFRVSAKAVLEGRVQRAVPAPFEGFIATAPVHAGDVVRQGDVIATLDDKDLRLEQVKWRSERERLLLKLREAMSKHDPATGGQLEAQLRQTDAQLALATEKLARTRIVAPVDGLVVSGDLSQSLGAPVETGKVLFEIAPLDEYRVIVRLDERDIRFVRPGQSGRVLLHGLTDLTVPFTVRRITSVAETDAGRNTFRVEGTLNATPPNLRPGMEGVGKIEIEDRSFAWVWTRSLLDWARMQLWYWTP